MLETKTTTEARTGLSQTLARFREQGVSADPLIFGDHRRPEGVVVPYELFVQVEAAVDQVRLEAAREVMQRIERVAAEPDTAVLVARRRRRRH